MTPALPRPTRFKPAALMSLLFLTSGCASLRTTERDLLETVEAAARGAAAADTVWPGYRTFRRGFIVFAPGRGALLVADATPPAPWVPMSSDEPNLRGRLYRRGDDLPGLTGGIDTGYPVGERAYPAVEFHDAVNPTLTTLYHEAFHAWQDSAFTGFVPEHLPASATAPEQVAAIELERRILAAALRAAPGPAADSLIAAFLAARGERLASVSDSVRQVDRSLERLEGTAHLVGVMGTAAALDLDPQRVRTAVLAMLEVDLSDQGGNAAARYYRWRAYGTGSAMGLLLDQIGTRWRADVAAGAPLDSLLAVAARVPPSAQLLVAARARFGYADLLRSAEATFVPASEDPFADFLALAPHRLVIEIVGDSAVQLGMSFEPGDGGFSNPHPSVSVIPDPARASMTAPAFDLSSSGRPIMMDGRTAPTVRIVVLLPFPARIDGQPAADLTGPSEGTLRITGEDTEATVRGDHLLSIDSSEGVVTVRVRAR